MSILVLNAGSSSIKFQLFSIAGEGDLERQLKGRLEGIGATPRLIASDRGGELLADRSWLETSSSVSTALQNVVDFVRARLEGRLPLAIGHRVVHGGVEFDQPVIADETVLERLERLVPLAPLHQPNNLRPIRVALERLPDVLQVACFDTAFHRGHSELADRYALPERFYREGIRRYGFHGLSYEYIAGRLGEVAPEIAAGRVVVAHLGSGASLCALSAGRSLESTMGFTALDGLPMGTRAGQLDPGVVLYLLQQRGMTAEQVEHLLYHDSGLIGLSGSSPDVRALLDSSSPRAKLAIAFFVYRIALLTGSLVAALGGIDGFVFTAGAGENAPAVRQAVAERLAWLGLELDMAANLKGGPRISRRSSGVACYVIPTDEELVIARHTLRLLRSTGR